MDLCLMGMEFGSIGRLSSKRYKLLNSMIIATQKEFVSSTSDKLLIE